MTWLNRRDWLDAVRREAKSPPEKVKPSTVVAVAAAFYSHGDEDGTRIQPSCDTVAAETMLSTAQVSRVRRWIIVHGLGHVESASVRGRKATWWHAAIPGQYCGMCPEVTVTTASDVGQASPATPGEREEPSLATPEEREAVRTPPATPLATPLATWGERNPRPLEPRVIEEEYGTRARLRPDSQEAERVYKVCLICRKKPPYAADCSICAECFEPGSRRYLVVAPSTSTGEDAR